MYKLILVDDEEEVRRGISEKIDWNYIGFEVAGEGANGIEAMEIAEKVAPDVVITDIKMPFMDGIALSQKLKEKFPTTKVIILTGFDEFEYAQKAVKLNIVEYILKPVSSGELINILQRVKSQIDDEVAQRKNIEILKEHYKKSLPILKEKYLGALITNKLKKEEIDEKFKNYGINIEGKVFVSAAISIDNEDNGSTFFYENSELMKFAALNIAEEVVNRYGQGVVFLNGNNIVIIFSLQEGTRETIFEIIFPALEEIRQYIEKYHDFTVTIGVGSVCEDITQVSYSYKDAVTALDYKIVLTQNRIIYIDDMEPKYTNEAIFDEIAERSLISCIKVGSYMELEKRIEDLFSHIADGRASFKEYQIYFLEILTAILKVAKDLNADMDKLFGDNYNLFVEIYNFNNLNEVKSWLMEICIRIKNYVSKDRQNSCKLIIKKAKEYIENNYQECDITIDKICRYLHISPTYFSTLFKRETRMTFVNYLTNIRMEAAKELLRTTDLKTFEVAKMVGYSEPNYFSYSFKKNFDMSPSQYRKSFKTA